MKTIEIEIPDGKRAEWINGVLTLVDEPKEDDRPVTERIKTFEDAVDILGEEHQAVFDYYAVADSLCSKDIFAFAKLRIIAAALNEGWEPTFDKDERRYYPLFYLYTQKEYEELDEDEKKSCRVPLRSNIDANAFGGLAFTNASYAGSYSDSYYGVRLAFKTAELAEYCGKQFIDIWADFLFA